ncbi:Putative ABC transport system membrane protein [Alloactinosynnema sp. L-07]|uniref:ABC transporter permease n=1 Tax=Alloactinosynnema sp. L-07 TaxID=1653480 RepID=UPI00065EFB59|nr:ABC transporter permease [Alloactinosynnema sp. L-07]CRK60624.1 Putative ABC transport system membrane protein [Alloactinosynnema sp. L-07]
MTLLAVERIKLFSTRSPWWSIVAALGLTIGFTALSVGTKDAGFPVTMGETQFGRMFGLMVVMVMAALAVTTEYRFSTIRTTFQAIPNRSAALLAKTAVVGLLAAVIGEVAAFGSWGIANLLQPAADLGIHTAADWRLIAGTGLVYGLGAVLAVAVGTLIRQSAGAVSVLLIWPLLVETLVQLIPKVGQDIAWRMPFTNANEFVAGPSPDAPFSPWVSLAYFAGTVGVFLAAALVVASKRDA